MTHKERRTLIDYAHKTISVSRQTKLLDISRASIYYTPTIDKEDIAIMHAIDKIFTVAPVFGTRRLREDLRDEGFSVGRDRIRRLMRTMGIEAIYPTKRHQTSTPDKEHKTYPYLLRNVTAQCPDHIWGSDITYIRLEGGFCYLTAIIDWFSRHVLTWEISETLASSFCTAALTRALSIATPKIHNSDKGVQYTSAEYTDVLKNKNVQVSMDGRRKCFDNIFTERLWRTVKYEDVYLKDYRTIDEARAGLDRYFLWYNTKRKHQSLNYVTPASMYFGDAPDLQKRNISLITQKTTLQNPLCASL